MTLIVKVRVADQTIVWVSDSFADYLGATSATLTGSSVFDLLEGSPSELWHSLFTSIASVDEEFDRLPIHRVGAPQSVDEFELCGVRYVDSGRNVMISMRTSDSGVGYGDAKVLAEVEQRYDRLLRGSFDGVIVHDGRTVQFMNAVAGQLIGIEASQAVGTQIASVIDPKRAASLSPADAAADYAAGRSRMLLRQTSGALVEVGASLTVVSWRGKKAVQVIFHDLKAEHHSRRSDTVRQFVEENVTDAVISTDEQLLVVGWNRSASELYGWSFAEVEGKNIAEVIGPAQASCTVSDAGESDDTSDVWMGTLNQRHRDGHELSVESAQIVMRDTTGRSWGILEVNRRVATVVHADPATTEAPIQIDPHDETFVAEFRAALANGDIFVAYQPIVELDTRRLRKVEALARWTSPSRGVIYPSQFIPLAERSGIIDDLGDFILERACTEVLLMDREGIDVELSANISVKQLRDPAVSGRIARILTKTGFPPRRLSIEVTEGVLLDDDAILPLQELHDLGIRLVIDDFGTGYATFKYLTRFPVDTLKIDATFISGLGTDNRDTAIVRAILTLSRELNLHVVAEGIETETQRAELLALQCPFGQGFLFDRGLPFAEFVIRYRDGALAEPTPVGATSATELSRSIARGSELPPALTSPALTPTMGPTGVDPQADAARLAASRALLRTDTVEAAVGVCIALVRELGGRTIPARLDDGRALPMDCSFGHGEPLLPITDSTLARARLELVLPEVLEDARLVISRIRQHADLNEQTRTDPLTGLMNRRAMDRVLASVRTDDALVAIDLDHFKSVNDTWGHAVGDEVLIEFSRALRGSGRSADHLGRMGGEELLAVLPNADDDGLAAFLNRLHETWEAVRPYKVTYSIGCAWPSGRSGNETLGAADAALYQAKQTGRDRAIIEPRPPTIARTGTAPQNRRKKDE